MGLLNDADTNLYKKYTDICDKLALGTSIINEAWDSFQAKRNNVTLEGEPSHWIACAIYAACWRSASLAHGGNYQQGSCVNFTSLLRHCNLSLEQFFTNIRCWAEMANMPDEFKSRIDHIEKVFAVSFNIFKKYQVLFSTIFRTPELHNQEQTKQHKNRRQRSVPCTPLKVFEFCWTLFITIKGDDPSCSSDLVSSYHLLIALCDWAFKDALLTDRRNLLNPDFEGLPSDFNSSSYAVPTEAPCIVSRLCPSPNAVTAVQYIKQYQLKNSIKNLFDRGVLTGKDDDYVDVFDQSVFERNFKNIANTYENEFLNKCDFDEKIFLAEYRRKLLEHSVSGTTQNQDANNDNGSRSHNREMGVPPEILTPLTGRRYVGPREPHNGTHSGSTENIAKINALLIGRQPAPSENLVQLFESCARNPTEKVNEIIDRLRERFIAASPADQPQITNKIFHVTTALFYKYVENILENERSMHSDISNIVEKDTFYECMFACCLEIVMYSYNYKQKMPWVLDTLGVQAYNFVKVIELIIRSKDKLSRDITKHLSMIEETILSSLVWRSDSIIWQAIETSGAEIPKFEETALPGHIQDQNSQGSTLRNILNSEQGQDQSPGPSAVDRFMSPVNQNSGVQQIIVKDQSGQATIYQVVNKKDMPKQPSQPTTPKSENNTVNNKPRKTGGLAIVFRKFYALAGARMEHLCTHLKITNDDLKRKIWTTFEEIVRKDNCMFIKDRDLDQLLMCALYIICKLDKANNLRFEEIMKSYRKQPQATSEIYRNVLIRRKGVDDAGVEIPEVRRNLIEFYNTVIIKAMNKFIEKFVDKGDVQNLDYLLSPLPASRKQLISPVVQVSDKIFVKPLESPIMNLTGDSGKTLNYCFSRSPGKNLKDINRAIAIKGTGIAGKRLLVDNVEIPNAKRMANRKVQSLIEERRQNTE